MTDLPFIPHAVAEAGRRWQLERHIDSLCVERDELEADGDNDHARRVQAEINQLLLEVNDAR